MAPLPIRSIGVVRVLDPAAAVVPASIRLEAVRELGLQPGSAVTVLVKSTEVMLGVED
jgi:molybdopterin-binding protein